MKAKNNLSFDEIGKELPFCVPDNYFEQFASQIEAQIGYKPRAKTKIFRPWMYAVAAVFVGVAVLTPIFYSLNNQRNIARNNDSYESYVLSQVDESVMIDCYVDEVSNK